ncbi:MAG: hypothetical protein U0169_19630 [Polyangiaceae bacterium]
MSEPARPPVAIRVTRPCRSEDEFLENELETISRTGILLVDAGTRPEGVVLRFEVLTTDGKPLVRGEGRVVGIKQNVLGSRHALALRFTRLDPASKALVDRATLLRDARRAALGIPHSAPSTGAFRAVSSLPPPPEKPIAIDPVVIPEDGSALEPHPSESALKVARRTSVLPMQTTREETLERLRKRAEGLSPEAIRAILESRKRDRS